MRRTYLILILLGIVVLSVSNIYLWKDRQQSCATTTCSVSVTQN
jgi:hypothetical protein